MTVDTNLLPVDDLLAAVPSGAFKFSVVSVTDREVGNSAALAAPPSVTRVPETAVWDESVWGGGVWGGPSERDCLEKALLVVGAGSFPAPKSRSTLSEGQRRQLRDAMIFCAHVRAQRNIFVTNDVKGFVRDGRREKLEKAFATRVMTRDEFVTEFGVK